MGEAESMTHTTMPRLGGKGLLKTKVSGLLILVFSFSKKGS